MIKIFFKLLLLCSIILSQGTDYAGPDDPAGDDDPSATLAEGMLEAIKE